MSFLNAASTAYCSFGASWMRWRMFVEREPSKHRGHSPSLNTLYGAPASPLSVKSFRLFTVSCQQQSGPQAGHLQLLLLYLLVKVRRVLSADRVQPSRVVIGLGPCYWGWNERATLQAGFLFVYQTCVCVSQHAFTHSEPHTNMNVASGSAWRKEKRDVREEFSHYS